MARRAFTEHPQFFRAGQAANGGMESALFAMGLEDKDLFVGFEETASRVVDDLTRLLLRAVDAKQKREQASRDFIVGKIPAEIPA